MLLLLLLFYDGKIKKNAFKSPYTCVYGFFLEKYYVTSARPFSYGVGSPPLRSVD